MVDAHASEKGGLAPAPRPRGLRWRSWLRALHRDFGYFVVGLTFVYAASGLAVNHIADWDPNFIESERTVELGRALPDNDDDVAAVRVREALQMTGRVDAIDRVNDEELELRSGPTTVTANLRTGSILVRDRKPRRLLRAANWLHLNRGKKAWTIVADGYAVLLLLLATSGLFMLPGRKGLLGRGGVLLLLGTAVPVAYVIFSGGP